MKRILLLASVVLPWCASSCSELYARERAHEPVAPVEQPAAARKARNVVLMIGDGMGAEHVWAAWLSNKGALNITNLPVTGFSITTCASHAITDSAAGGTAIACGCKAIKGQLGLDAAGTPHDSLAVQMRRADLLVVIQHPHSHPRLQGLLHILTIATKAGEFSTLAEGPPLPPGGRNDGGE